MKTDEELIWEAYVLKESTSYSDEDEDGWPITVVTQDNQHDYTTVNGIKYELRGDDAREEIAYIGNIESTEGNEFYPEHVQRYVEYIQNGGILETFPVQEINNDMSIDNMVDNLEETMGGDMYTAPYWKFQDIYGIDHNELDNLIELYKDKDLLDEDEEDEAKDIEKVNDFIEKVNDFYNEERESEYHLQDMNHRFEALKQMGIKTVMVDVG